MPTLSVQEIVIDVIDAFTKQLPMLPYIGADWRKTGLKLNKKYTAHVVSVPAVETISDADYSAMTGQTARSLLTDVDVTVDKHIGVRINLAHLNSIKDDKQEYAKAISLAGYALAKSFIDDIITGFSTVNFSNQSVFAVADSDGDMLDAITSALNLQGALTTGRFGVVNTPVAAVLNGDQRLTSSLYAGQRQRGEGYRRFQAVNGFAEIMEYPDLANTTSGTALTSVTATAATDVFAKTAHGLATGQGVTAASFSAGVTAGSYYVIRVDADTFKLATSFANAQAGTAYNVSSDGTGGSITPTQTLTGFFGDARSVTVLGGIPDGMDAASALGVPVNRVNNVFSVTHPDSKITMAGITWETAGRLDANFVLTMVYGKALGRQAVTNGVAGLLDNAGHRLVSA